MSTRDDLTCLMVLALVQKLAGRDTTNRYVTRLPISSMAAQRKREQQRIARARELANETPEQTEARIAYGRGYKAGRRPAPAKPGQHEAWYRGFHAGRRYDPPDNMEGAA